MTTSVYDQFMEKFHEMAAQGDTKSIESALKGIPDLNIVNDKGWTALMFAARNGKASVVELLLERGSDASVINAAGQTALDIAKFWNQHTVVEILEGAKDDHSPSSTPKGEPLQLSPSKPTKNFLTGSPLDRADYRRKDKAWLEEVMKDKRTKYLLFKDLQPAVVALPDHSVDKKRTKYGVATAGFDVLEEYLDTEPTVVFLGIYRADTTRYDMVMTRKDNPESDVAWFGVDATKLLPEEDSLQKLLHPHAEFLPVFPGLMMVDPKEAGIVGQARSLLAWHERYRFCPTCGSKTKQEEAGYKRVCLKEDCDSHNGVHNTSYPRVDPTAIMAVASPDGKQLLLGRSARFPGNMWSCLAGFIEPGESIEEACRREVFEEAGVYIDRVEYHSSQPWPMPSSLMIGCLAHAISTDIKIDKDELQDARWFSRQEVLMMLTRRHPRGMYCPPEQAVAHQLIKAWVNRTSNL